MKAFFSHSLTSRLEHEGIQEAPLPSLIAMVVTALASIGLFLYPKVLYDLMTAGGGAMNRPNGG